ncbi:MAG: glycosyltransferase family 4 protein [Chthoniobacterales bacterium]|nr:glycosyltransferase family 4 protein [Chthoniobacterales bacterium]
MTDALVDHTAVLDCFHGSTPWIDYHPPVPYSCYLDVCFATYMSVYHDRDRFQRADLERIELQEASWLRSAARVFFSSQWALDAAVSSYGIERNTLRVAGLGGHVPVPAADEYAGGREFLFIALDFAGKGGDVCVDAFARVRERHPEATLRIVGERPPSRVSEAPGVIYEGYLRKSVPGELRRLQEIFAAAFALVHPTVRDATPQVIVEAQYHGCPAIAPRSFGIPEMVMDGVTGWLVDAPPTVDDVVDRMLNLLTNAEDYRAMRCAARAHALARFTWQQVGDRMAAELMSELA